MAAFNNELIYSLTVPAARPAAHGGLTWLIDKIAGASPQGDRALFFRNLTRWHSELIKSKNDYRPVLRGVLLHGKNRRGLDELGSDLARHADLINHIEECWRGQSPQHRFDTWGQEISWDSTLEIRNVGFAYARLQRVDTGIGRPIPLAEVGVFLMGHLDEETALKEWIEAANGWLDQALDSVDFSLLHRVLVDIVAASQLENPGLVLGRLYRKFQELGFALQDRACILQREWVTGLAPGAAIPNTDFTVGQQRADGRFATSSDEGHVLEFDADNPATFLARMAARSPGAIGAPFGAIAIGMTHLDAQGRFALIEDNGEPAWRRREIADEPFRRAFETFFQVLIQSDCQPAGLSLENDIRRRSDGQLRLVLRSAETEPLNVTALEQYFLTTAYRKASRAQRQALVRRWMRVTGLSHHTLSDQARAQFIADHGGAFAHHITRAAAELRADYALGSRDPLALVKQQLQVCLRNDAHAIAVIPEDFADLLMEHVAAQFHLQQN